jgi:hypothetical protein
MTPLQCGSERTVLKIRTAPAAWAVALCELGYAVEHRPVRVGENLNEYSVILVGISKPNAIAAGHLFSGLEILRRWPNAIGYVDDWQTDEILAGFRCYANDVEMRLWRLDRTGRDAAYDHRVEFEELVQRYARPPWNVPMIVPLHGSGSIGNSALLKLPTDVIGLDPTVFFEPYLIPENTVKERRWLWASLLKKPKLLDTWPRDWPVTAYGNRGAGKGGIGKSDTVSQERLPEPELAVEYARSWGIISPAHRVSGSGWWRVRYQIARDVGSVLCAPRAEAELFGEPYLAATDPRTVTCLNEAMLRELVAAQREAHAKITTPREAVLEKLKTLIEERT